MFIKRVIITLTLLNGILYGTRKFKPDYRYTFNFVDTWDVDEIIILDITKKEENDRENYYKVLKTLSENCFVPITAGGNINNLDEIKKLLSMGADKVAINSYLMEDEFLSKAVKAFGSSCIVGSIDCKKNNDNYEVFNNKGKDKISSDLNSFVKKIQSLGVGEILIQSIDKDGALDGFDINLLNQITSIASVPVLACSGAGNWKHFYECFNKTIVSGACTTNIFHFTNKSIRNLKKFLKDRKIKLREINNNILETN